MADSYRASTRVFGQVEAINGGPVVMASLIATAIASPPNPEGNCAKYHGPGTLYRAASTNYRHYQYGGGARR
jgi:hypothetical protein